jgi:hypothetical protein
MSTPDNNTAAYYAGFVQMVVDMYFSDPANLTPPLPSNFPASEYELIAYINAVDTFLDDSSPKFFGFVIRSTTEPAKIIIAIRGTEALVEWLIDFEIYPTNFTPIQATGYVEDGFFSIYRTMTFCDATGNCKEIDDFIESLLATNPAEIIVAGHSLGATLATMFTLVLVNGKPALNSITSLYTFASPSLGDTTFANYFNATVANSYRYWNEFDLVPQALNWLYTQVSEGGIELIQTQAQIQSLKPTLLCEHILTTYLWLLNSGNPLCTDCQATNPAAVEAISKIIAERNKSSA